MSKLKLPYSKELKIVVKCSKQMCKAYQCLLCSIDLEGKWVSVKGY